MSENGNKNKSDYQSLEEKIQSLETRLGKIEKILRIEWVGEKVESELIDQELEEQRVTETTESRIFEYGLAWLGSIVFLFGIIFLMSYIESLGYPLLSKAVAYLLTALVISFSYYSRESFSTLAYVLNLCSVLLLYFITVGLHFFTQEPVIANLGVSLILIFIIIGYQLYNAIKKNAEFLASLAITLSVIAAVIVDSSYITFIILLLTALTTHLLFYYKLWWRTHVYSLFIVYIAHLFWLFSNPILGNQMKLVDSPNNNILFLFGYAIIYSLSIFIPQHRLETNGKLISIAIWNALGFSFLLLIIMPSFYSESYPLIFSAISIYCLVFSVILKLRLDRNFAPATYASFGFAALSVAIYGFFGLPDAFLLLVLQSLLVVSLALWYRSQIIVVANAFLFISILLLYLIISDGSDFTNFAFAITALATARILGWRKERLTLKTDIFRNIYLLLAFSMILYGLNQALPSNYVTLAWTATAIGFFLLSVLLGNIKYRYLSILTIVITGGHLFFIDLGQMDVFYRVIAFLVFALITLGVSLYYTKKIRKKVD